MLQNMVSLPYIVHQTHGQLCMEAEAYISSFPTNPIPITARMEADYLEQTRIRITDDFLFINKHDCGLRL
ncbi:hypothetical protein MU1_32190 [Paenibacillus glycanilyticus]|uniref:Uncharacterized protein n=1 Tax=Paenibacillus glycanilyticus TaxID=126569 RepID=A0ABQ6GD47_9BACL|nr:hypothetical protein MU1_32190 [Paenibacillus glycanilyticus]